MTRSLSLQLDAFGRDAIDRFLSAGEGSLTAVFRTAALYYLADRDSGRAGWRVPRFPSTATRRPALEVPLDDKTWEELEHEAQRQKVATDELAVHALIYFLADLDRGRLPSRLEEELEEEG